MGFRNPAQSGFLQGFSGEIRGQFPGNILTKLDYKSGGFSQASLFHVEHRWWLWKPQRFRIQGRRDNLATEPENTAHESIQSLLVQLGGRIIQQ